ncbi:hypothetical protein SAMN04487934_103232 [Eubacterium ruminantium]|nr:hypothetical protein SAMN04487934_103232 [Eubacterium ruminantium]
MGIFDDFKRAASSLGGNNHNAAGIGNVINNAAGNIASGVKNAAGNKSVDITFAKIPSSLEEFKALPQAACTDPFSAAALTVIAFNVFTKDKELSYQMLDYLRGPRPLSGMDKQFINDRFMDGKDYVPRSYFKGAVPQNDYTPAQPLTITVSENPYTYQDQGYAKVFLQSGGADSPRAIQLRQLKDGKWCLWEQFILSDIRQPESANPWA